MKLLNVETGGKLEQDEKKRRREKGIDEPIYCISLDTS